MSAYKIGLKLTALILLTAILSGCATPTATPTTAPNGDQQATVAALGTQVAGTLIAGLTQNAPAPSETSGPSAATNTPVSTNTSAPSDTPAATATPEATSTPTLTSTPVPPTATVPPTPVPTWTPVPWTATPSRTPTLSTYNCTITSVSPASTDTLKTGADFDGKWVVKNSGSLGWDHTQVDIKYLSGKKFQVAGEDLLDMKVDVASGASATIIVDMVAPTDAGTYYASWGLVQSGLVICNMNLTVVVVK